MPEIIVIIAEWIGRGIHEYREETAALGTVIIAFFTFTLWRSTARLWKAGEQHSERELRAYVHIDDVVVSFMNSEFDPNVQMIIKNFGQTPARRITNTFQVEFVKFPFESKFSLEGAKIGQIPDLAPGERTFSQTTLSCVRFQAEKPFIGVKKVRLYVFGRIDYWDIFGKNRTTEYRRRLLVDSEGIPDESSLVSDGHEGNRIT